ncbi:MAG: GNAT family N-acetyltransferase [Egicoccus sp.]
MRLRPIGRPDLDAVLDLNASEVPKVGPLDAHALAGLVGICDLALLAEDDDGLLGMVLALAPGAAYRSPNYGFFEARGSDHLYVDRIAVATGARRRGVASALYDAVEERGRATGRAEVTCEVNLVPRNDVSLRFHAARGFVEVAQQDVGDHRVSLLAKPLA